MRECKCVCVVLHIVLRVCHSDIGREWLGKTVSGVLGWLITRIVWHSAVMCRFRSQLLLHTEVNSEKAASAFYPPDRLYKIDGVCMEKHRSSLKWERQGPLRPLSLMLRLDMPNEANVPQSPFLFSLALAKLARSLKIRSFQQHGKRHKKTEAYWENGQRQKATTESWRFSVRDDQF